jgi:hypothetical protein
MIYTSTQGEERLFPGYFSLPMSHRLHPGVPGLDRVAEGIQQISGDAARTQTDIIGTVVAGWADAGLHPETFWLGYAAITAAGWRGSRSAQESEAAFYKLFYGDHAINMDRVYQLMSQQAQFWADSWEQGPSSRKPIFGYSAGIYNPRKPVKDPTLTLPGVPGPDLKSDASWISMNNHRLELASDSLADNDELLGLLHENLGSVERNRYNLEVYTSIAQLCRQNLEMLIGIGRIWKLLDAAQKDAGEGKAKDALGSMDRALEVAETIRLQRNTALGNAVATWYKSWFPRVAEANGHKFVHELDDVRITFRTAP